MSIKLFKRSFHIYHYKDNYFALDRKGSGLYSLSKEAYETILHNKSEADIKEIIREQCNNILQTIQMLKDQPPNTSKDQFILNGLWLGVAHCCNLNCSYCFAKKDNYLSDNNLKMDFNIAKNAIDFLIKHKGSNKNLNITFFGGEPLLNFDLIIEVLNYSEKIEKETGAKFSFSLTTNGTLLDKKKYDLIKDKVEIMISIDGTKEIHDQNRKFKNGYPSWDLIMSNLHSLKDYINRLAVRATISDDSLNLVNIYKNLKEMGFKYIFFTETVPNTSDNKCIENFNIELLGVVPA